jgi:hypothetical protein
MHEGLCTVDDGFAYRIVAFDSENLFPEVINFLQAGFLRKAVQSRKPDTVVRPYSAHLNTSMKPLPDYICRQGRGLGTYG